MIEADKIKEENEKELKELKQAYFRFSKTDDGKMICKDLESFCGFLKTSTNVAWNPYQTMFAEGKRRVFLRIISMMVIQEQGNE